MSSLHIFRKLRSTAASARYRRFCAKPQPGLLEDATIDSCFLQHGSLDPKNSDYYSILRFPQVRISSLPNGIRVVTQTAPLSATHTASVGVWIDAGSRYEALGTNGTAHFLEHMIFKGTKRRTSYSLEEEIENMGARLNAYTSREQTTFYADVLREDVPVAIDVLADILQHSKFPEHAIKRERGVILREMEEVQGQMQEVIFDHLHAAAFHGHPLGDTILGPPENIRSISRENLRNYISTHYSGHRMVISAAGAVNHDDVVNLVKGLFKRLSKDPTTARQLLAGNPAPFSGSEVRMENGDLPEVHLAIAFRGASWTNPSSIALMVMQSVLGSWSKSVGVGGSSGSQLAQRVCANSLAESIMSFNTNYGDTGLFGVYAVAAPDNVHELSDVMMQEFRRLASEVSEEEVLRARNQLKSALVLHIDGATSVAENNGRQMLTYGRVIHFLELFARIDAVDVATVKEAANSFLIDKDVAVAAMGPIQGVPDLKWFRSQTHV